jgi:archaellum component FlaF (FlaF/FlaG flagellin family)
MKNSKIFVIILSAVLIGGSGGYILAKSSNTPVDTAGRQKTDTAKSVFAPLILFGALFIIRAILYVFCSTLKNQRNRTYLRIGCLHRATL